MDASRYGSWSPEIVVGRHLLIPVQARQDNPVDPPTVTLQRLPMSRDSMARPAIRHGFLRRGQHEQ